MNLGRDGPGVHSLPPAGPASLLRDQDARTAILSAPPSLLDGTDKQISRLVRLDTPTPGGTFRCALRATLPSIQMQETLSLLFLCDIDPSSLKMVHTPVLGCLILMLLTLKGDMSWPQAQGLWVAVGRIGSSLPEHSTH